MACYQIHHRTHYAYELPVAVSHHCACLTPQSTGRQRLHNFNIAINPPPSDLSKRQDYFGNQLHLFSLRQGHGDFTVETNSEVSVEAAELPIAALTPTCDDVRYSLHRDASATGLDARQYLAPSPCIEIVDAVRDFAAAFLPCEGNYLDCATALAAHIHDSFTFDPAATDVAMPITQVLEQQRGVCQDFAHVMIACLRARGLPARYVSGYILTHPPPGQPRLIGADASHAWVAIYIPQFGWVDIDPTNRQFASEEHVTVAVGRDFSDVSMLKGAVTGGGEHTVAIQVTLTPLAEPTSERLPLPQPQPKPKTDTRPRSESVGR